MKRAHAEDCNGGLVPDLSLDKWHLIIIAKFKLWNEIMVYYVGDNLKQISASAKSYHHKCEKFPQQHTMSAT
jgi:hypothetical protein